jgi:hypothetical protein
MLKKHWVVLGHHRGVGVTLRTVIDQYHAGGRATSDMAAPSL